MSKRFKNPVGGPFAPRLIEMLRSPAYRALSRAGHQVLARLEIELASHRGTNNGQLIVTFAQLVEYGLHPDAIAPAIRELVALGFIEVTEQGRGGNAEWRRPSKYRLSYRPIEAATPTHEWRDITEDNAAMIAKGARRRGSNSASRTAWKKTEPTPEKRTEPTPEKRTEKRRFSPPETGVKDPVFPPPKSVSLSRSSPVYLAEAQPPQQPPAQQPAPASPAPPKSATPVNGTEHSPIVMPVVKPDRESLAAADAVLSQWIAERDRLHKARSLMPNDDERLLMLCNAVPVLAEQIRVVRRMA
jgi:hypothetical protein